MQLSCNPKILQILIIMSSSTHTHAYLLACAGVCVSCFIILAAHVYTHEHTLAHIVQLEIGLQLTLGKGKKTHSQGVSEGERGREG